METTKNLTQLQLIKRIILVGLGLVTVSWLISTAFASNMEGNKAAVKERNRIEEQMKLKKQDIMVKAEEINVIAKQHEAKIDEFAVMSDELTALRKQREQANQEIDGWINEGFDLSQ